MTDVDILHAAFVQQGERKCIDDQCPGVAEAEQDGEYWFYECEECGSIFGYQRVQASLEDETCAVGISEDVRRAASAPYEKAAAQEQGPVVQPSIGFRRD